MLTNLTTILNDYENKLKNKQYDAIEDNIEQILPAAFEYVLQHYLKLEKELKSIRRGSFFSTFSPHEIHLVAKYDEGIACFMNYIWMADNNHCMHLDFVYEDYEEHDYESPETYIEALDNVYTQEKYDALDMLNRYVLETYGPIFIDLSEDLFLPTSI